MRSSAENQEAAVRNQYEPEIAAIERRIIRELAGKNMQVARGRAIDRQVQLRKEMNELIEESWECLTRVWGLGNEVEDEDEEF